MKLSNNKQLSEKPGSLYTEGGEKVKIPRELGELQSEIAASSGNHGSLVPGKNGETHSFSLTKPRIARLFM